MEFFRIHRDIPFMRHALVFNIISFVTFALAVFFLVTRGLHLSVEFTGGTLVEVSYAQAPQLEPIREALAGSGVETAGGAVAVAEAAERPADWIMSDIVGAAGLVPGFRALPGYDRASGLGVSRFDRLAAALPDPGGG